MVDSQLHLSLVNTYSLESSPRLPVLGNAFAQSCWVNKSEGRNLTEGSPFHTLGVVNLANNETLKEIKLPKAPQNKLLIVEFVGINGFVQPNQHLFVSLEVYTNSVPGIYPIVPIGVSTIADPTFPTRRFGSQQVLLYADPDSEITVAVARDNGNAAARVFVDVSGRIVTP